MYANVKEVLDACNKDVSRCNQIGESFYTPNHVSNKEFLTRKLNEQLFTKYDQDKYNQLRNVLILKDTNPNMSYRTEELKSVCPITGECITFGYYQNDMDRLFKLDGFSKVKNIRKLSSGAQGFVCELEFEVDEYKMYLVLKSSLDIGKTAADNLYYEYKAGNYLNKLLYRFPLFCKTYGAYLYREDDRDRMYTFPDTTILTTLFPFHDTDETLEKSLTLNSRICITVQHVHNAMTMDQLLKNYTGSDNVEKENMKCDILAILYQIYFVLAVLPGFTHGDLHLNNILLTPAGDGKCFHFTFESLDESKVSFNCQYTAKIIDYGRCCFPGSADLKSRLVEITDPTKKLSEEQLYAIHKKSGYDWDLPLTEPCNKLDLLAINECAHLGIIPLTFISDAPLSIPNITQWEDCSAFVRRVKAEYKEKKSLSGIIKAYNDASKKGTMPNVSTVCPFIKAALDKCNPTGTYECVCDITIFENEYKLMIVKWMKKGGTRKRRRRHKTKRYCRVHKYKN